MKTVKQNSILFILGGMIYLNVYFHFLNYRNGDYSWIMVYFIALNLLWIDFVIVSTNKIIKDVTEEYENQARPD
jgi:hypothetical protein